MTNTFKPCPKPSRGERISAKQAEQNDLRNFRAENAQVAIDRDGGLCAICYFKYNRIRPYDDVHHVYSRGKRAGDCRERYTSLLCVCRQCHPLPIMTPGASKDLGWVEDILRLANEQPINKRFKH